MNLLFNSEAFDQGAWAKNAVTVGVNAALDPFGALKADKIIETAADVQHSVTQAHNRAFTQRTQTLSVYLKAAERTTASVYLADNTGFAYVDVNLAAGTITNSGVLGTGLTGVSNSIVNAGSGWKRIIITGTLPAATQFTIVYIFPNTRSNYLGNGTSGIYAFGAKLENLAFPTPYRLSKTSKMGLKL